MNLRHKINNLIETEEEAPGFQTLDSQKFVGHFAVPVKMELNRIKPRKRALDGKLVYPWELMVESDTLQRGLRAFEFKARVPIYVVDGEGFFRYKTGRKGAWGIDIEEDYRGKPEKLTDFEFIIQGLVPSGFGSIEHESIKDMLKNHVQFPQWCAWFRNMMSNEIAKVLVQSRGNSLTDFHESQLHSS